VGAVTALDPAIAADNATELAEWWQKKAHDEVAGLLAKMGEYGGGGAAIDLIEIGRALASVIADGNELSGTTDPAQQAELGVYFYVLGKVARWTAAVQEGRKVSDDTIMDIGIYTRMAERIREAGGWPNA
jgi:hypothetical protein